MDPSLAAGDGAMVWGHLGAPIQLKVSAREHTCHGIEDVVTLGRSDSRFGVEVQVRAEGGEELLA